MQRTTGALRNGVAHVMATFAFVLVVLAPPVTQAADSSRLGQDLTPMGAERTGNAEGTIPPWEGGLAAPPDWLGYQIGDHHPDPFIADDRLFEINAANAAEHRAHLTEGQMALFAAYPQSYRLDIYPSRRSCAYPEAVYAAVRRNAETARLDNDGNNVVGARMGSPFPIPESALEVVWNHIQSYRGFKMTQQVASAVPTASGDFVASVGADRRIYLAGDPALDDIADLGNIEFKWMRFMQSPPQASGRAFVFYNTIDQTKEKRKGWLYSPQNRKVVRAPQSAYDISMPSADGLRLSDNQFMYNGAPDKYDWTLIGKREVYVPYNTYRLASDAYTYDDVIQAGHLNQALVRYELHRVWVVDGRLRPGERHFHPRRTFYFDEDSWILLLADLYDTGGAVMRVQEAHIKNYYEVPLCALDSEVIYDLPTGRYQVQGLKNQEPMPNYFAEELEAAAFSPAGLRRAVSR